MKLAIIGCGAITEMGHLPAALVAEGVQLSALIDRDIGLANKLVSKFKLNNVVTAENALNISGIADGVVVATPPGTHAELVVPLLEMGIHVLVEKPFATNATDCDLMIEASAKGKATLGVAMARRFFPADLYVRQLIRDRMVGSVESFKIENGYEYSWPSTSNFILNSSQSGGGILMGLGSHVLDTLIWWLGPVAKASLTSDSCGGLDSESLLHLTMDCGATGTVEFSRSRNLENKAVLVCQHGIIEAPFYGNSVSLIGKDKILRLDGTVNTFSGAAIDSSITGLMARQLEDFRHASETGTRTAATAEEARESIALIRHAYSTQNLMETPWSPPISVKN